MQNKILTKKEEFMRIANLDPKALPQYNKMVEQGTDTFYWEEAVALLTKARGQ